jgi:hypothetical protein
MMLRPKIAALFIVIHTLPSAAQSEDPIDLQIEDYSETVCYANCPEYGYSGDMPQQFITHTYTRVMIQAKADSVTVESVEINRGNCQFIGGSLPQRLKFGDHVELLVQQSDTIFAKGCKIIEVSVSTDQGEITFSD